MDKIVNKPEPAKYSASGTTAKALAAHLAITEGTAKKRLQRAAPFISTGPEP